MKYECTHNEVKLIVDFMRFGLFGGQRIRKRLTLKIKVTITFK